MANYYVSNDGSDSNDGLSTLSPWKTLSKVNSATFSPGDMIRFKCGDTWSGELNPTDSGASGNQITYTSYGTGSAPRISNSGGNRCVDINANYITIDGLYLHNTRADGVFVDNDNGHCIVRNCEITDVGSGITFNGTYNLGTLNYIHDLNMIVNTPGGNDDYGATAFKFRNTNNEASYNTIERCAAPSYDFGTCGGGFDILYTADDSYVHHNFVIDTDAFLEVGMGSAVDCIIAYNVSINNGRFSWLHLSGEFASVVENFRVENNTIYELGENPHWLIFGFGGYPDTDTFSLRNNIVYVDDHTTVSNRSDITHEYNLYYRLGGTALGFTLGTGEIDGSDPLFTDADNDDLTLQAGSPAIDAGTDLGYTGDIDGNTVPSGSDPDMGAYEYTEIDLTAVEAYVQGKINNFTALISQWQVAYADYTDMLADVQAADAALPAIDLSDVTTLLQGLAGQLNTLITNRQAQLTDLQNYLAALQSPTAELTNLENYLHNNANVLDRQEAAKEAQSDAMDDYYETVDAENTDRGF